MDVLPAGGMVTIAATDLHSDGFGFLWGQTRAWTNGPGYATNSDNGSGWVDTYTPHLLQADGSTNNTLIFIANGNTAYYYDLVNGVYQPRIDDGSKLTYNSTNDTYTIIDTQGDQIVLDGFGSSWLAAQHGQFASYTDPYGTTMAVTSYTSDGHIAEEQRSATSNGNITIELWQRVGQRASLPARSRRAERELLSSMRNFRARGISREMTAKGGVGRTPPYLAESSHPASRAS